MDTAGYPFAVAPPREGAFILSFSKKERIKNMKKALAFALITIFLLTVILVSCTKAIDTNDLWNDALYTEDMTFGEGANTVFVEVKVVDKSVTFTIKTDKKILGDALLEHELISGETGQFGLYIKSVNGITADYDINQSYWGFYKNGDYMITGVDSTEFTDGDHYELEYKK